jgi:alkylhydroperoxidase family enzyme
LVATGRAVTTAAPRRPNGAGGETHAPDADYAALKAQFSEEEQVTLTLLIGIINSFNMLGVGFRATHPVEGERRAA